MLRNQLEMTFTRNFLVFSLAAIAGAFSQSTDGGLPPVNNGPNNTLTSAQAADGYQLLWNGRNFTGWKSQGISTPATGWVVVNQKGLLSGDIHISADPDSNIIEMKTGQSNSDLFTMDTSYRDFDWQCEWKDTTTSTNSGLLYGYLEHVSADYNITAAEYQICNSAWSEWPGTGIDSLNTAGTDYYMYPLLQSRRVSATNYAPTWCRAMTHWNQSRIIAYKNRVAHYGNGLKLLEYNKFSSDFTDRFNKNKYAGPVYPTVHYGSVFIQNHGQPGVKFRNIKIKKLTQSPWSSSLYVKTVSPDTLLRDTLTFGEDLFPTTSAITPYTSGPKIGTQITANSEGLSVRFSLPGNYILLVEDVRGIRYSTHRVHGSDRIFLPGKFSGALRILTIWNGDKEIQRTMIGR